MLLQARCHLQIHFYWDRQLSVIEHHLQANQTFKTKIVKSYY